MADDGRQAGPGAPPVYRAPQTARSPLLKRLRGPVGALRGAPGRLVARAPKPNSLHRRLSWLLLGPLLAVSALSGGIAYFVAVDGATRAYDRSLLDPALALAKYLDLTVDPPRLKLSQEGIDALRIDTVDRIVYQVSARNGVPIYQSGQIPQPPPHENGTDQVFYDTRVGGVPMRAVALYLSTSRGPVTVQVAETKIKRRALVREVFIGTVIPEIIVILSALILLWFGIRQGLAPLEKLRSEIKQRSPADLHPVPETGAPLEVRPLVQALNALLARLASTLSSQQQFIGNAAHQLRTPLAGLSAHAELAARSADPQEVRELVQTLRAETKRTTHLVNQLLSLARVDPGGAHGATFAPVNLAEAVDQAATDWVRQALAKNVDIGFELAPAWMSGQATLIRELATNLVDNAISYTPKGGTVTVTTRADGDYAVLEVEDNGPGIPEAARVQVFERFYRVPGTPGGGCGLGLAIVRDIAQRHGGDVKIENANGPTGTRVRARFPRIRVADKRGDPESSGTEKAA